MLARMSPVVVVWVVIGSATLVVLAVMLLGLVRQMKRLASSVVELRREIEPALRNARDDAERARTRSEDLQRAGESLRRRRR
jgi:Sec-independent protein translocase protein TatA